MTLFLRGWTPTRLLIHNWKKKAALFRNSLIYEPLVAPDWETFKMKHATLLAALLCVQESTFLFALNIGKVPASAGRRCSSLGAAPSEDGDPVVRTKRKLTAEEEMDAFDDMEMDRPADVGRDKVKVMSRYGYLLVKISICLNMNFTRSPA